MITIIRTNSDNIDFINLVKQLDSYLKIIDGNEHSFYDQYNGIESLKNVVVAYLNSQPIGCGAFKSFDGKSAEIKRMFTHPDARKKGAASKILFELETWAKELNFKTCILETGKKQHEAVGFYNANNYAIIPNYGQYKGIANSLCFEKNI